MPSCSGSVGEAGSSRHRSLWPPADLPRCPALTVSGESGRFGRRSGLARWERAGSAGSRPALRSGRQPLVARRCSPETALPGTLRDRWGLTGLALARRSGLLRRRESPGSQVHQRDRRPAPAVRTAGRRWRAYRGRPAWPPTPGWTAACGDRGGRDRRFADRRWPVAAVRPSRDRQTPPRSSRPGRRQDRRPAVRGTRRPGPDRRWRASGRSARSASRSSRRRSWPTGHRPDGVPADGPDATPRLPWPGCRPILQAQPSRWRTFWHGPLQARRRTARRPPAHRWLARSTAAPPPAGWPPKPATRPDPGDRAAACQRSRVSLRSRLRHPAPSGPWRNTWRPRRSWRR